MVVRGGGGCGGSVGGGAAVRARVGRSRARLRLGVVGSSAAERAPFGRERPTLRAVVATTSRLRWVEGRRRLRRRLRFCNPENFAAAACALMSVARYKKGVKGQKKIWCGKKATEQKFL